MACSIKKKRTLIETDIIITGLILRYLMYSFSRTLRLKLLDQYCDVSFIQYMNIQTAIMCEYKPYVLGFMNWFLDAMNQIIKDDSINERFDQFEQRIEQRFDQLEQRFDQFEQRIEQRFDKFEQRVEYMINPSLISSGLLNAEDLMHQ